LAQGSRAQSVDALFIPIFAMVMTSRMSLYVMLMSSYVFLNSLYGCGGCDGDEISKCIDDNSPGSGTTAPGRMLGDDNSDFAQILARDGIFKMKQVEEARFDAEGRSLSDVAKKACEDIQKMVDCYKGNCDCTCADLNGPDEDDIKKNCGDTDDGKNMKLSEASKAAVAGIESACTGDNKVTDPCA